MNCIDFTRPSDKGGQKHYEEYARAETFREKPGRHRLEKFDVEVGHGHTKGGRGGLGVALENSGHP